MNDMRLILGSLLILLTSAAHAELLNFDGSLTLYGPTEPVFTYPYTGQIDYDSLTQTGFANFDPILFKGFNLVVHDVSLTQTGGTVHANGLWDWVITALPGDASSFTLLDTDGDGIPGIAFTDGPFPGFTMAIEGVASPVPLLAAVWFFGSCLLGLFGLSKRKNRARAHCGHSTTIKKF